MRSSKPTNKAQSEAPSVDSLVDEILGTGYINFPNPNPMTHEEAKANFEFSESISELKSKTKAKINRLIVQGRLERGIYELERLEHDPQMFGDWEKVVEERIHLLETELSALSNNLSKEDGK